MAGMIKVESFAGMSFYFAVTGLLSCRSGWRPALAGLTTRHLFLFFAYCRVVGIPQAELANPTYADFRNDWQTHHSTLSINGFVAQPDICLDLGASRRCVAFLV